MKRTCVVLLLLCACLTFGQQTPDETAVWKLEHQYWENVKAGDLTAYRALWHPNFVGWPSVSPKPARKDHITDWIANYTSKGMRLKQYTLEPAASQATGDIVVTHYWITDTWVDKNGKGAPEKTRIMHTWLRTANTWQIISGMSKEVKPAEK